MTTTNDKTWTLPPHLFSCTAFHSGDDGDCICGATIPDEWDGFGSQRELLAATVYNVRAESPRDMTPDRWNSIKRLFPGSYRQCLEQADEELETMDE